MVTTPRDSSVLTELAEPERQHALERFRQLRVHLEQNVTLVPQMPIRASRAYGSRWDGRGGWPNGDTDAFAASVRATRLGYLRFSFHRFPGTKNDALWVGKIDQTREIHLPYIEFK